MTSFRKWPSDGGPHTSESIGAALAGLIRRDSNGLPVPGVLGPLFVTAVPTSWQVEVSPFTYVVRAGSGIQLSGLSAAEQVDIEPATGIPAGQGRIDLVAWDTAADQLVVIPGAVSASPVVPAYGGLEPVATVRVNSGDGSAIQSRIAIVAAVTGLASGASVAGVVPVSHIGTGQTVITQVTFPVGMFTVAPVVVVGVIAGGAEGIAVAADAVTAEGFTLRRSVGSNRPRGFAVGASWQAMQV